MTVQELFQSFLAGRDLPSLATSQARSLLDLCRSKLLARGITTSEPSDTGPAGIKSALLAAHRQLTGGAQVYASADKGPLAGLTGEQAERIMQEHKATGRSVLELVAVATGAMPAPPAARSKSAPAATAAPATPGQLAKIAQLEKSIAQKEAKLAGLRDRIAVLEQRKSATASATARTAKKTAAMLGRRAAAAKPAPAAVPPRPLADASTGHLAGLVSHPCSPPAARAAAAAELALRPQVTIYANGATSVSTRGGRARKAANRRA